MASNVAFMNGMPLFNTVAQKAMMAHIRQVAEKAVAITAKAGAPCPIEFQSNADRPGEVFLKLSFGAILRREFPFEADVLLPSEPAEEAAKRYILSLADMLKALGEKYEEAANGSRAEIN